MVLLGRYLSPFVRRVATTMNLYGLAFEHRPLLAFGDDKDVIRQWNPVGRVPTLVLDDGEAVVDSAAILDYLDRLVGPERALTPAEEPDRHRMLSLLGIATGAVEKAVLTVYEVRHRPEEKRHAPWVELCARQARDGFHYLEARIRGPWMNGETLSQADVTAVCYWDFVKVANPELAAAMTCPGLDALSERANAMPAFADTRPDA
ncbi:MAG: glutathione S-transferase family protein [Ectothiorhodospiraceae bacterium]|nr:glutathione S-transferase family protein [Chromatiales bacterium]MCP5155737.1 glutathione S-transferase family protein [Ectothiorhodospiraceae bacterium]